MYRLSEWTLCWFYQRQAVVLMSDWLFWHCCLQLLGYYLFTAVLLAFICINLSFSFIYLLAERNHLLKEQDHEDSHFSAVL